VRLLILALPIVQAGLRHVLEDMERVVIVGEAVSVGEAVTLASREQPDLAIVDIDSEDVGVEAVTAILNGGAGKVMVITESPNARDHARAVELGASGVLSKALPLALVRRAVERVADGEMWLDRERTAGILRHVLRRSHDPEAAKIGALSKREREVVQLVGEGLRNAAIGERLFISEATARNHLTSILGKLELSGRFELAVYAHRHGLVENDPVVMALSEARH
jgi:two-component system, NarL family, nitrate/nitrite response regulator NarL